MDNTKRKAVLTEALKKATGLNDLYNSENFQRYLLPYLQELANIPHIDPANYDSEDKYLFALKSANQRAGVYSAFIKFMASQQALIEKIKKEFEQPQKNYDIGV